jgi:predicted Zn finger-like uncharacterized protein
MILTCPECGTQYVVKEGAIPLGGRQVRCASCKHSWHQDGELSAAADEEPLVQKSEAQAAVTDSGPSDGFVQEPAPDQHFARPPDPTEPSEPLGYRPRVGAPDLAVDEPAYVQPESQDSGYPADDDFAPFGPRDNDEEPRRRGWLKLLLFVLLVAAAAIAFWFFAPAEWKARLGIAENSQTQLQIMMMHSDRQPLASGNELLAVTGRVINPTDETQPVPPIQARLLGSTGQVIYSWTIAPPARTLPPRQSATFNSAEVNVPSGAVDLALTLGPRV